MFYRCRLKEQDQQWLSKMYCNRGLNTKTINKQIVFSGSQAAPHLLAQAETRANASACFFPRETRLGRAAPFPIHRVPLCCCELEKAGDVVCVCFI